MPISSLYIIIKLRTKGGITIKDLFNFDENYYFYHVTGDGNAKEINKYGLLVNGDNILGVTNLLFTTAAPLTEDLVDILYLFLDGEINRYGLVLRPADELVVIGVPKEELNTIVKKLNMLIDGTFYQGIIRKENIMGYFDSEHEFHPNENFIYGTDEFYLSDNYTL